VEAHGVSVQCILLLSLYSHRGQRLELFIESLLSLYSHRGQRLELFIESQNLVVSLRVIDSHSVLSIFILDFSA